MVLSFPRHLFLVAITHVGQLRTLDSRTPEHECQPTELADDLWTPMKPTASSPFLFPSHFLWWTAAGPDLLTLALGLNVTPPWPGQGAQREVTLCLLLPCPCCGHCSLIVPLPDLRGVHGSLAQVPAARLLQFPVTHTNQLAGD